MCDTAAIRTMGEEGRSGRSCGCMRCGCVVVEHTALVVVASGECGWNGECERCAKGQVQ